MRQVTGGGVGNHQVSIRARHCWRAMRFQPKALKRLTFFTLSREQGAMN
jgi:hypothetical protein